MVVRPSALQRGGDKNAPAATFGAYLCAVRTMLCIVRIQHCKRLKGVCQGGTSPLTLFCFLLQEQKEGPAGEAYRPSPPGDSAAPLGDYKLALNKNSFAYFSSQKSNPPPGRRTSRHPLVTPRRRQAPTNPPLIRTANPSFCFPIKPTIYTILAQYLPKM